MTYCVRLALLGLTGVVLAGCPTSPMPADDGGPEDDVPTEQDGGVPMFDAGPDEDRDGDGLVSSMDCDDDDPEVFDADVEACTSDCGFGTRVCARGRWSGCSAPTDCSCPTAGEARTIACGRCGLASQSCIDGLWSAPSACLDEQDCLVGDVENESARCGRSARICDATCHWRDWTVVVPQGECEPGEERRGPSDECGAGEVGVQLCGGSCDLGPTSCEGTCVRSARPSRLGLPSVCIPDGPFQLGHVRNPRPAACRCRSSSLPGTPSQRATTVPA